MRHTGHTETPPTREKEIGWGSELWCPLTFRAERHRHRQTNRVKLLKASGSARRPVVQLPLRVLAVSSVCVSRLGPGSGARGLAARPRIYKVYDL